MQLNSNEIEKILPHRYPFLLVDRITDCEPGVYAEGRKCVTANEMQFIGHFPGQHVMPGVLIIEAMAQTAAVSLLTKEEYKGKLVLFGGIDKAKFRRQVVPGDVLDMRIDFTSQKGMMLKCTAEAKVEGQLACKAELTCMVVDRQ